MDPGARPRGEVALSALYIVWMMNLYNFMDGMDRPHRRHYYLRLVQIGWEHRETVRWEYVLMGAALVSTVIAARALDVPRQLILLGVWGLVYRRGRWPCIGCTGGARRSGRSRKRRRGYEQRSRPG